MKQADRPSTSVLYGAQTERAIENFPISGRPLPASLIRAIIQIKQAAAQVNLRLGLLDERRSRAIQAAAQEILDGQHTHQFPVDVFQTGSGTSTNMNVNEVLATRGQQLLGARSTLVIHPNDHVNLGQSSNDVIPTAIHLAALAAIHHELIPALNQLQRELAVKTRVFDRVVKIGRTHLVDATPIRLGQEFGGYARQVLLATRRIKRASDDLRELPLGGTAVGTGLNTHPEFAQRVIQQLVKQTKLPVKEARNHFEAQSAKDAIVSVSSSLKSLAVSLTKIANDIRWLASGPRAGLAEITLPSLQAGSSIMPGKVNPVLCESVLQVAADVIGSDLTITLAAGQGSTFELNTMMPIIALRLLESIAHLSTVSRQFATRCVAGIQANRERCEQTVEQSLAMVTPLAPAIGYDAAAAIAQEALKTGETVRQVASRHTELTEIELTKLLNPWRMTSPEITQDNKPGL